MNRVELRNVGKYYGTVRAVHDATLTIRAGEFFTLLGPSGCGKTTILRIISGFVEPTSGRVWFDDQDITYLPPERRNVGMVFQNYALFPHMTVAENVAYGLNVRHEPRSVVRDRVDHHLELVRLAGYRERKISELSGGQQQRVALARALAIRPRILLLDEPLSNLDAKLRDEMRIELKQIQRSLGITTVYVTHDQQEALTMSDRIAVFDEGICQQIGAPREIYDHPANAFVATFVGETNIHPVRHIRPDRVVIGSSEFSVVPQNAAASDGVGEAPHFTTIRPEDVRIYRKPLAEPNEFPAVVRFQQFNGSRSVIDVDACDVVFRISTPHTTVVHDEYQAEEEVYLSVDPAAIRVVSEERRNGE